MDKPFVADDRQRHTRRLRLARGFTSLATIVAALALWMAEAAAQTRVDLNLVIAVDVSLSMDLDEQRLQREGYVAAFRDAGIHKAIGSGAYGRIAVIYVEWAGSHWQTVIIPWAMIDGPEAARAFADRLEAQPISRERWTSISGALQFAKALMAASGTVGVRRIVDVSGDGPNNAGSPVLAARDALLADGVVINGLPITLKTNLASFYDIPDLDRYYASCVIGGAGSFMVPVKDVAELKEAIRRKLLLEISGLAPPRLVPAQVAPPPAYDCLIGERQWQWYLDRGPN